LEYYIIQSIGANQLQKWIDQYRTATQIDFVQRGLAGITGRKNFFGK
jgi:transposase-like protein